MYTQNHRLNANHNYTFRFPIIGRSYLNVDYSRSFLQCFASQKIATNYIKHNKYWLRSKNIHSHTLVFWNKKSWFIQFIVFDQYIHGQRRVADQYRVQNDLKKMFNIYILNQKTLNNRITFINRNKIKKTELYNLIPYDKKILSTSIYNYHTPLYNYSIFSYTQIKNINNISNKYNRLDTSMIGNDQLLVDQNYKQMFKLFINQIRPRGARIGQFLDFDRKMNLNHYKLIKNNISFRFRVIRYVSHGNIMMWLNYIRYRVSERSVYQIRSIVYNLERYTKSNNLRSVRLAHTFKR